MLEGYLADLPGWIAGQEYATQIAFSETLEAFIRMEANAQAQLQTYPPAVQASTEERAQTPPLTWQDVREVGVFCIRSLARQKATWGLAAAAVIALVALAYATWFGGGTSQPPTDPIADLSRDTPPVTPLFTEPLPVATVLNHFMRTEDVSDSAVPRGTELARGEKVALRAGDAMQLQFPSGARVILQGPGQFDLFSAQRVGMQQGRLTAVVPPEARGFTVSTAQTDFIDHGTEFALTLDETGHGEVVVLDGLIEAKRTRTGAQQSLDEPEHIMLREGVGGRLVPDAVLPKAVESLDQFEIDRYARNWDDVVYRPRISDQITYTAVPPASLAVGQTTSTHPLLIPERRGVTLAEDLALNSDKANRAIINKLGLQIDPDQDYVIDTGTRLNSFLIHFDLPKGPGQAVTERDFEIRFSGRILAIVQMHEYQAKTDAIVGLASVQYPSKGSLRGAADPPEHPNHDVIHVSDDLRTLSVKMRLAGFDQIRVLVENTDP